MSDNKAVSALTDVTATKTGVASGSLADASEVSTYMDDQTARIADTNDALADEENNRAGTSAPTDNTVEGRLWADTTNDPLDLKLDPDGSGADHIILTHVEKGSVWPSFNAYRSADQANITTIDKVEFEAENFDTNSDYDKDTNFRFTPTVAGKYLLIGQVEWKTATVTDGDSIQVYIYKNGAVLARHYEEAGGAGISTISVSTIEDANGTTDYFEVFASNADRDTSDLTGDATGGHRTFFCGSRIA